MSQLNNRVRETTRSRRQHTRKLLAAALALALGTVGGGAQAATQLVTNCSDHGSGSLRAAITAAMSGDIVDATGLTCSTISLSTGALGVSAKNLTVSGPGPNRLTVTNGAALGRVFRHEGIGTLTLRGMTITSGVVSPTATESGTHGGCIYSKGFVSLGNYYDPTDAASGVVVSDCTALSTQAGIRAEGGGIFAESGVGLAHSKVTNAHAIAQSPSGYSRGGGIYVSTGRFLMKYSEVSDCTVTGFDGTGGGIYAVLVDTVNVTHSTIANNSAADRAGGAYLGSATGGVVTIDNTTISGNSAPGRGGLVISAFAPGAIHIYSSTITANHSGSVDFAGATLFGSTILQGTIVAGNINILGNSDLRLVNNTTGTNNLIGVVMGIPPPNGLVVATDPKLGPLTNRGGFTRVHLPLANSPAINAGNNVFNSTTDQRGPGFPRVIGSAADIGAAEYDPDRIFNNGFD